MKINLLLRILGSSSALVVSASLLSAPQTVPGQPPTVVPPPARPNSVPFDQLPTAAQNAILGQTGTAPVQSITEVNGNGQRRYIVRFQRQGQPMRLEVDSTGRVLNGSELAFVTPQRAELSAATDINFDLLPVAVRETLKRYSMGAPILNITKGTVQGQTVYQAAFQHRNQNVALQVAENGGLIRDQVNDRYLAAIGMEPGARAASDLTDGTPVSVPDWRTAPARKPLASSSPANLRSVPEPVRSTVLKYAGGTPVGSVLQGTNNGRLVYEAEIHPNGQRVELRVTDAGAVVNDQVNDRFLAETTRQFPGSPTAVGLAPDSQTASGTVTSSSLDQLGGRLTVPLDTVPLPVQTTIKAQASGAPVDSITQGTIDGHTVYEATFQQAGHPIRMRIADDGSVLEGQSNAR